MMVIYHSAGPGAELAAALHLGLLPPVAPDELLELSRAWELVNHPSPGSPLPGRDAPTCRRADADLPAASALRLAGEVEGVRVLALQRQTHPDVVERAFGGMAEIFDLDRRRVVLVPVQTGLLPVADRIGDVLCHWGAERAALSVQLWSLRSSWKPAAAAVQRARARFVH